MMSLFTDPSTDTYAGAEIGDQIIAYRSARYLGIFQCALFQMQAETSGYILFSSIIH